MLNELNSFQHFQPWYIFHQISQTFKHPQQPGRTSFCKLRDVHPQSFRCGSISETERNCSWYTYGCSWVLIESYLYIWTAAVFPSSHTLSSQPKNHNTSRYLLFGLFGFWSSNKYPMNPVFNCIHKAAAVSFSSCTRKDHAVLNAKALAESIAVKVAWSSVKHCMRHWAVLLNSLSWLHAHSGFGTSHFNIYFTTSDTVGMPNDTLPCGFIPSAWGQGWPSSWTPDKFIRNMCKKWPMTDHVWSWLPLPMADVCSRSSPPGSQCHHLRAQSSLRNAHATLRHWYPALNSGDSKRIRLLTFQAPHSAFMT